MQTFYALLSVLLSRPQKSQQADTIKNTPHQLNDSVYAGYGQFSVDYACFISFRFSLQVRLRLRPTHFIPGEDPMSVYVGNLSYDVTREDLERVFSEYGEVSRVSLPTRSGNRSVPVALHSLI